MGLIKLSLRSLKTDIIRSLFYFASFVLTTYFIFSFFNLTLNPITGIQLGKDDNTFVTMIAILVICVAMFCVFLANNFYVGHKNQELSVILMSGASVYRLGFFLLIQSFLIMIISIPLGLVFAYCSIPFINIIFQNIFSNNLEFYFSWQAITITMVIVLFEVVWCTILNFGYCYRNSVFSVLQDKTRIETYGFSFKKMNEKISILLYLLPLLGIIFNDDYGMYLSFSLFAVLGVPGLLKKIIPRILSYFMHRGSANDMIAFSFVKENLKSMTLLINLMCISSVLLMTLIFFHLDAPLVSMVALVSYTAVNVLLSITLFFKLGMLLISRKKSFVQLRHLGFIEKDLKKLITKEMITFYLIVLFIPLIYHITMLLRLIISGNIQITLAILLICLDIIPLCIAFILSYSLYRHHVILKTEVNV